jgi:hypothetical protein
MRQKKQLEVCCGVAVPNKSIDRSPASFGELLEADRQSRADSERAAGVCPDLVVLMPLMLAIARLAAQRDVARALQ